MRLALTLVASMHFILPAAADQATPGRLAGHALVPALTFFDPPADAPADLAVSGKFTGADRKRVDALGAMMGASYISAPGVPRETGVKLPFKGQPMQGFSGLKSAGNGEYWVLQDNGFGTKVNSADAMLVLHRIKPDWTSGKVDVLRTIFVHDPDRKIPFQITLEGTAKRYLTGADLDVESFQTIGDQIWIGDEFGPYLIRIDQNGKVNAFFETQVDGKPARSPDHYLVSPPAVPGGAVPFTVRRSRGYEAMAASKDGRFLYPLLEGPLWDDAKKAWEMDGGREYLRILEFDVNAQKWTGRHWKYRLEVNGNNIGDFNMIDATTGLIIERDNGEGELPEGCTGAPRPDCFNTPAKMKRITKIEMTDANAGGFARKVAHLDLLAIKDPDGKARLGTKEGIFTFPFVTIEGFDIVDDRHIIVGNDNNLPYSSGRKLGKQDDNELILVEAPELLKAK
jgi:hypothetical protein